MTLSLWYIYILARNRSIEIILHFLSFCNVLSFFHYCFQTNSSTYDDIYNPYYIVKSIFLKFTTKSPNLNLILYLFYALLYLSAFSLVQLVEFNFNYSIPNLHSFLPPHYRVCLTTIINRWRLVVVMDCNGDWQLDAKTQPLHTK